MPRDFYKQKIGQPKENNINDKNQVERINKKACAFLRWRWLQQKVQCQADHFTKFESVYLNTKCESCAFSWQTDIVLCFLHCVVLISLSISRKTHWLKFIDWSGAWYIHTVLVNIQFGLFICIDMRCVANLNRNLWLFGLWTVLNMKFDYTFSDVASDNWTGKIGDYLIIINEMFSFRTGVRNWVTFLRVWLYCLIPFSMQLLPQTQKILLSNEFQLKMNEIRLISLSLSLSFMHWAFSFPFFEDSCLLHVNLCTNQFIRKIFKFI